MKKYPLIILFFAAFTLSDAQTGRDSLNFQTRNYSPRILSTVFDKQLNTYSIRDRFSYFKKFNAFFIGVSEDFNSTVIKSTNNSVKDEQNFNLLGEYDFNNIVSGGLLLNSSIYSDDRDISINEASIHSASLFGKFNPANNLSLIPFGGYTFNKQVGETDEGLIYGAEAILNRYKLSDLFMNASFKFENEDISPRKNSLIDGRFRLASELENSFRNYLDVKYYKQRKDFYFSADTVTQRFFNITNNIQIRSETQYGISNRFFYKEPNLNSIFEVNGSVLLKDIERETRYILVENINASTFDANIEELRINLNGSYRYTYHGFNALFRVQYAERQETHKANRIEGANEIFFREREESEKNKNNESRQVTLTASTNWNISERDKIFLSVLHRKFVYDTPSENNFDDRDELLSLFRVGYYRKLNPLFTFYANTEVALNHIVYIYSERSSNNNYKRFIKFNSGGIVTTKNFTMNASAEVSASYTVYDFEDLNPNFKSYSFRQMVIRDSTSLRLTNRLYADLNGYVKLSEQGDFRWNDFKTRPSRFLEEVLFLPKLVFRYGKIELGVGIRYFSLQTYIFNGKLIKVKDKLYNSIGPLSDISVLYDNLIFKLNGWYEFIRNEDNTRRELVNLRFQMDWNF